MDKSEQILRKHLKVGSASKGNKQLFETWKHSIIKAMEEYKNEQL